jgi:hypothetical protein
MNIPEPSIVSSCVGVTLLLFWLSIDWMDKVSKSRRGRAKHNSTNGKIACERENGEGAVTK